MGRKGRQGQSGIDLLISGCSRWPPHATPLITGPNTCSREESESFASKALLQSNGREEPRADSLG